MADNYLSDFCEDESVPADVSQANAAAKHSEMEISDEEPTQQSMKKMNKRLSSNSVENQARRQSSKSNAEVNRKRQRDDSSSSDDENNDNDNDDVSKSKKRANKQKKSKRRSRKSRKESSSESSSSSEHNSQSGSETDHSSRHKSKSKRKSLKRNSSKYEKRDATPERDVTPPPPKASSLSPNKKVESPERPRVQSKRESSSNKEKTIIDVGELISKNVAYINMKSYYYFKFMIDDTCCDFYGNSSMFSSMQLNKTYELTWKYNTFSYIVNYKECTNAKNKMSVNKFVTDDDFDGRVMCVPAKLKFGFKLLDSDDNYKFLFAINYRPLASASNTPVYIETVINFKKLCTLLKDLNNGISITTDSELLRVINGNLNKMVCLMRVKFIKNQNQNMQSNLRNFIVTDISKILPASEVRMDMIHEDQMTCSNISRMNKSMYGFKVYSMNAEQANDRIIINFNLNENGEMNTASYFIKNNYNNNSNIVKLNESSSNNAQVLQDKEAKQAKLFTDINQLNKQIYHNFVEVQLFVICDNNNKYSVFGITKKDIETGQYYSL
ncbi:LEF-3 [Chrysodeixis includens nucleopolyhedrovirus]|uniref:LEF-3 n=1 Tax=Chrysodeixis includens nucleopolyhedrovirus TaxID=1207438 RepID=A0A5B8YTX0_9ABAC|nr:LEF-3 [Chrysodeixis includens nucleopolyhedrovirus]QED40581.1 LEF-3 [Chrysodeixis includens nucleopolyhedrovirus]